MNIGIVGLGLMGGSMAKSVKFKTGHNVFAFDIDKETMMLANLCGALDGELACDTIKECEVIFLALDLGCISTERENKSYDECGNRRRNNDYKVCFELIPHSAALTVAGGNGCIGHE